MVDALVSMIEGLHAALISFQPVAHSGDDCATLFEKLAALESVSGPARVRAAAWAGECGAHRERGFAEVSDWMARVTGSTVGAAKAALDTAAALESQPEAKAALDAGELSFAQARELVRTEAAVPGSTADLLDVARTESFRTLKERAQDRRVRAIDPEALHALQHAAMSHRTWVNALGNIAYSGELPPELGVPFANILDAETDRLWRRAYLDAKQHDDPIQQDLADTATDAADNADKAPLGTSRASTDSPGTCSAGATRAKGLRRSALAALALVGMIENSGGKGKANRADIRPRRQRRADVLRQQPAALPAQPPRQNRTRPQSRPPPPQETPKPKARSGPGRRQPRARTTRPIPSHVSRSMRSSNTRPPLPAM